jgi:hypothetical protein
VVAIAEPEEFLSRELCAVVNDNGVWYSKMVDDVGEKLHGLFGFNCSDWPDLYPLSELVDGDKQVRVAPQAPSLGV